MCPNKAGNMIDKTAPESRQPEWYAVRCLFHHVDLATYEERITLWSADSFEVALRRAEDEAVEYAQNLEQVQFAGLAQAFHLFEPPADGAEVFALMRDSALEPQAYLTRYFDTGAERQQR